MEIKLNIPEFDKKYSVVKLLHHYDSDLEERRIYVVKEILTNDTFVCKFIKYLNNDINNSKCNQIENKKLLEYSLLRKYSKDKDINIMIVKFIEYFKKLDENGLIESSIIITDYYKDGDLSMVDSVISLEVVSLFLTILVILFKFNNKIIHRDIKPSNIFFKRGPNPLTIKGRRVLYCYLGDFGSTAEVVEMAKSTTVGTPKFIATEVKEGKGYTGMVDVYSLGATLLSLMDKLDTNQYGDIQLFETIFKRMCSSDVKKRPTIRQLAAFAINAFESTRCSPSCLLFSHPDSIYAIQLLIKYNQPSSPKTTKNVISNCDVNVDIQGRSYRCISSWSNDFFYKEYIIENYYDANNNNHSVNTSEVTCVRVLNPENYKERISHIAKVEELIKTSPRKWLWHDSLNIIKSPSVKPIIYDNNITQSADILLCQASIKNSFKVYENKAYLTIPADVQLKAVFHLILVAYELHERGGPLVYSEFLLGAPKYGLFLVPPPSLLNEGDPSQSISNYQFKYSYQFILNPSTFYKYAANSMNPFYTDTKLRDPILTTLFEFLNDNQLEIPTTALFRSMILVILKEKERILSSSEYSDESIPSLLFYFEQFEIIIADEMKQLPIQQILVLKDPVDQPSLKFTFKSYSIYQKDDSKDNFKVVKHNNKFYSVEKLTVYDTDYKVAEFINYFIERTKDINDKDCFFTYFDYWKSSPTDMHIFQEIPNSLIENYNSTFQVLKNHETISDNDKFKLYSLLILKHISNIAPILSKNEYFYNLMIAYNDNDIFNSKIYYLCRYFVGKANSLFSSFSDIGVWVFGSIEEFENKVQISKFLNNLGVLYFYPPLDKDHHYLDFSLFNLFYYFEKYNLPLPSNLEENKIIKEFYKGDCNKYSIIAIGSEKYHILNIYEPNHIKYKIQYKYHYESMILELQNCKTTKKFICFRRQYSRTSLKDDHYSTISNNIQSDSIDFNQFLFTVQDSNVLFFFYQHFSVKDSLLTIENFNFNEKYNNKIIIRCFYLSILNLLKEEMNNHYRNGMVLINLSPMIHDENNKKELYIYFDFFYFFKRIYGIEIFNHWDTFIASLSNPSSLVTNYFQSNQTVIFNDRWISINLFEKYKDLLGPLVPLEVIVGKEIQKNVHTVKFRGKQQYIRKELGSIERLKEWKLYGHPKSDFEQIKITTLEHYYEYNKISSKTINSLKQTKELLYTRIDSIDLEPTSYLETQELFVLISITEKPGVSKLVHYYLENDIIYGLLEYYDGETLESIKNIGKYDILFVLIKLIITLKKIKGICHRDINPSNILCKRNLENGQVIDTYLIDFGLSNFESDLKSNKSLFYSKDGRLEYIPPEIHNQIYRCNDDEIQHLEYKMDIFSLGIVILALMHNNNLSKDSDLIEISKKMTEPYYKKRIELDQLFILAIDKLKIIKNDNHFINSLLDDYRSK